MRAIKFRAWDKRQKKMREVNALYLAVQMGMAPSDRAILVDLHETSRAYQVDRDVDLMQFTGLLDKNGKEIYDGDIVYAAGYWDESGVVYWNDKQLQWWVRRCSGGEEPLRSPFASNSVVFEIIGNIYENPDLLRGQHVEVE